LVVGTEPLPDWLLQETRKLNVYSSKFKVPPHELRELKLLLLRQAEDIEITTARNRAAIERSRCVSCFWASSTWPGRQALVDSVDLTEAGRQGLAWAREISDRRTGSDSHAEVAHSLAARIGVEASVIWEHVRQARLELFGDTRDGGVRARARALRRPPRRLAAAKCGYCGAKLPRNRTRSRRYCPPPRSCKVYAWRQRQKAVTER
jgi:hypothetical protein